MHCLRRCRIGKGFEVELNSAPHAIPFEIVEGIAVPTNAHFTFGFINALVDSSGSPVETSSGVIDFDNPSDGGEGVGGIGTANAWAASSAAYPVAALGTTFAGPGCTADEIFISRNSSRAVGRQRSRAIKREWATRIYSARYN